MARRKVSSYNDGIAKFYKKKDIAKNVRSLDDLIYLGFLYYKEKGKRQEDIEFAEQHGKNLTLKIETQDCNKIDAYGNVVVDNVIYSVIHTDRDKINCKLYFYLEEVRKIET